MIIGIDEVGRGCWAGPLVVAGVALQADILNLRDSKKINKSKREELFELIQASASKLSVAWIPASSVDELGLSRAMQVACKQIFSEICNQSDAKIIIDGNINYLPNVPGVTTLVGGDDIEPAIMAASIVAKVSRDRYMEQIAQTYPEYGFERHVGYGTKVHAMALDQFGVTDQHRTSFKPIKNYLENVGRYRGA